MFLYVGERDHNMTNRHGAFKCVSGGAAAWQPSRSGGSGRCAAVMAGVLMPALTGWGFDPNSLFAVGVRPVVFYPTFDVSAMYSDNIYSLPDDSLLPELGVINSREDIAFILSPAVNVRLGTPGGDNQLNFDARFDQYLYSENPSSDSGSYRFGLNAAVRGAKLSYDCQNNVQFSNTILDSYTTVVEGISVPSGNVERVYGNFNHGLDYALSPKTFLSLGGTFNFRDYTGDELTTRRYYNSAEWRVIPGFGYLLSERIRLNGSVHYGQLTRDPVSDFIATPPRSDALGGTIGARGSFTPKLSGGIRAGYEHRWFSDDQGDDGYPLAGVDLTQAFTDRLRVSANYNHGGGVSASTTSRSVTVTDAFSLNVSQTVGYRRPWFLNLGVRYALTEYVTGNTRDQDNFRLSLGARYQITRWLSTYASYAYEFGTRSTYEYDANEVTLGLHFGY